MTRRRSAAGGLNTSSAVNLDMKGRIGGLTVATASRWASTQLTTNTILWVVPQWYIGAHPRESTDNCGNSSPSAARFIADHLKSNPVVESVK